MGTGTDGLETTTAVPPHLTVGTQAKRVRGHVAEKCSKLRGPGVQDASPPIELAQLMKSTPAKTLWTGITKEQSRDTGMAVVLVLLLLSAFGYSWPLPWAIAALVVTMTVPQVYRWPAVAWFGLAHLLGTFMSKVLLGLIFFLVVTPIALARRIAKKDSLKLGAFRNGRNSVMVIRDHTFTARDIETPY